MKKISEDDVVRRVAYEVSVSKLELVDDVQMDLSESQPLFRVLTT